MLDPEFYYSDYVGFCSSKLGEKKSGILSKKENKTP
jgi:hypothetical protein